MAKKTNPQNSYLSGLKFKPGLNNSFVAKYLKSLRIVVLLILAIFFAGILSYFNLPKRLNPEVNIPIVSVTSILPGASGEDMEKLVTIPLENQIRSVSDIDRLSSVSRENISLITVQFKTGKDVTKAKDEIRSRISSVQNLPSELNSPDVREIDFENQPIWTFALLSSSDDGSLIKFAQILKEEIEELKEIDRVELSGEDKYETTINISKKSLEDYKISPSNLVQVLGRLKNNLPAGFLAGENYLLTFGSDSIIRNIEELRTYPIQSGFGQTIPLGVISQISSKPVENGNLAFFALKDGQAKRTILFNIYKTKSSNIDSVSKNVKELVNSKTGLWDNFSVETVSDNADEINEQFWDLAREFRSTILLVFICLFIFLGFKQALVSLFTVPLTFLSAFFLMNLTGMSINFLSLFAFLLTLGLLVDDTIVVVSSMTSYYKTGKFSPLQAGILVWKDTIVPIWSTTITTIWSFIPLLLTSGIIGEFIKPIPVVVTLTMISSTAIAVLITLPLMVFFLKPFIPGRIKVLFGILPVLILLGAVSINTFKTVFFIPSLLLFSALLYLTFKNTKFYKRRILSVFKNKKAHRIIQFSEKYSSEGIVNLGKISEKYKNIISKILLSKKSQNKVLIGIGVYFIVSFMFLPLGFVRNEFFPKTDSGQIFVTLDMPQGSKKEALNRESILILEKLKNTQGVKFAVLETGRGRSTFQGSQSESSSSLFTLYLKKENQRNNSSEIASLLREEFVDYGKGKITVFEQTGGPPAGADIQIAFKGNDLTSLTEYADKLGEELDKNPAITFWEKSVKNNPPRLVFIPDMNEILRYQTSIENIGLYLRSTLSKLTVSEDVFETKTKEKESIVFILNEAENNLSADTIGSFGIPTPKGYVPLASLGKIELRFNPSQITREDGKRIISISATVSLKNSVSLENKKTESIAKELTKDTPDSFDAGGVNEENRKSVSSILTAMGISFLLILVTMVLQFNSYRQAAIVLLVIPLAVSSVFFIFALTNTPLSFPALIGILSLFGIVVTNSMFIVDKINLNRRQGMKVIAAIADAGSSRLEPIVLTKLSTVLGLLPITLADPLWRGLGGAIISGLLISSTIMLLFIPIVYYRWLGQEKNI